MQVKNKPHEGVLNVPLVRGLVAWQIQQNALVSYNLSYQYICTHVLAEYNKLNSTLEKLSTFIILILATYPPPPLLPTF
jgi:hypothetical protein